MEQYEGDGDLLKCLHVIWSIDFGVINDPDWYRGFQLKVHEDAEEAGGCTAWKLVHAS